MNSPPDVSVIICTRNNAASLRTTLAAVCGTDVPTGWAVELVVADNGSTDDTITVVADAAASAPFPVRHVVAGRRGKGYAYNAGVAAAGGRVFMFTDDDVTPAAGWVGGMAGPILAGEVDAIGGGVRLGSAVARPWIRLQHHYSLACTDNLNPADRWLVGANMAIDRHGFNKVPAFDPQLGPGRYGFGDESLFGEQIKAAGLRIVNRPDVHVIHNPDPARLRYDRWVDAAKRQGRSAAYIAYHWEHLGIHGLTAKRVVSRIGLAVGRLTLRWHSSDPEFADPRELARVSYQSFHDEFARLQGRPRNYDRHGLEKRRGVLP